MLKILNKILNSFTNKCEKIDKTLLNEKLEQLIINFKNQTEFDIYLDILNQISKSERFIRPLLDIVSENNISQSSINALEINLSKAVIAIEAEKYLKYHYLHPTEVNYFIVNNSIENLPEVYKNKSFKLIEWDYKQTSLPSTISSMDLIIYRDNQNISEFKIDKFLQEVYAKIRSNGFLLLIFRNKLTEPEIKLNYLLFNDNYKLNGYNLKKRSDQFVNSAQNLGLSIICRKSDSIGSIAILLRKVITIDKDNIEDNLIIEIDSNYDKWLDILKRKIEECNKNEQISHKYSNIWLFANNSSINGIIGLTNCLRQEPGGERIRCIFDYDSQLRSPLDFNSEPFSEILKNDLAINVIRDGKLGTYRHLSLPKNYNKVESNDYYLNICQYGDLSSLQWFDSNNIPKTDTFITKNNRKVPQPRCNIYSAGLNFLDVEIATGLSLLFKFIVKY